MRWRKTNKEVKGFGVNYNIPFADAYFKAETQGGTFQLYPTGLGFQSELSRNLLPNVNDYIIPFNKIIQFSIGAEIL